MHKTIAIIGAGPAGLMAAETLAKAGHGVTLYDRMPMPGRKFLMAGRGGLNLTHSEPLDVFLTRYNEASAWLADSIRAFPPEALRAWCESLGQETFSGSSGRIFPRTMKAAPLLRAWLQRLELINVQYKPRHRWLGWKDNALHFTDADGRDVTVQADATLLALGGASWPRLGSDGSWYDILAKENIALSPLRPANCGFIVPWSEHISRFAGQPLKPVSVTHKGITRQGEAMISAAGLEGGVIYALSASIRDAIAEEGKTTVTLDLRPDMKLEALTKKLDAPRGNKSLSNFLRNAGFSPLAVSLLREATMKDDVANMPPAQLAAKLKALPILLTATSGIGHAISTAGGITKKSLTDDFMITQKPGLFVAGEMLDWEAPTGGYLLQACFSTANTAAQGIIRYLAKSA